MIEDLLLRLGAEDLRESGEGFECRCFHCDSDRRSLRVSYVGNNGRPGAFICHKCHILGDLIGLTMRAFRVDRTEAEHLAKNSGDWIVANKKHKKKYVRPTIADIAPYRKTLSAYLADERGYSPEVIFRYRIGMDVFTDELVIPTYTIEDEIVGITRRVASDGHPYIHLPFPKSEHVFGLNLALIGSAERIYVTEGQLDPLGLYPELEDGEDVCAINGSYMSDQQAELLVSTRAEIVLAFDNDKQGLRCTRQSIHLLRDCGAVSVRVLLYPGSDPGKLPLRENRPSLELQTTFSWLSQKKNRDLSRSPNRRKSRWQSEV